MYTHNEILTIGYGGKHPQAFFNELESINPDMVVDVRANPNRAFLNSYTKKYLEEKLKNEYIWIEELGNPSHRLPPVLLNEEIGFEKLHEVMEEYYRIVLLCAEKDEKMCHRGYIKAKILSE